MVESIQREAQGSAILFLNLHDDENTAVRAAIHVIEQRGGKIVELRHTGERLVKFRINETWVSFDPNRMFTDEGSRNTLDRHGPPSEEAFEAVRLFADELLEHYRILDLPAIVTLHNNGEENYSALSYLGGEDYATDARAVYFTDSRDPDDFFFVTDRRYFDRMKEAGFNVVLQDNQEANDDGSLSVLAGTLAVPYINIESQHGHRTEQQEMIAFVYDLLEN